MRVHPFIVVCRLDKRKRHLATTCDADNSRSNRARRSLNKHGTPPSADVLRRECKGRQSKATVAKSGRLVGSDSVAERFPPISTRSRVGRRHDIVMATGSKRDAVRWGLWPCHPKSGDADPVSAVTRCGGPVAPRSASAADAAIAFLDQLELGTQRRKRSSEGTTSRCQHG